ncbi:site-specific DNA-methyltransferase [Methanocalculus natronophilus]|uniref:site-specific DNA-methyltransferase n=1 Tax=Methanocalculus natronophilus TaxID=1262400 RepID=UPI0031B628C8
MDEHKISSTVFNPASDNLRKLTALFPSIMKDGQVDFEALKAELGTFEEAGKEQYGLTWAGKQEAKKNAAEPVFGRTLKYVPKESKNLKATENLYIEGDNLEVLKLLQNSFMGKIKMIYIDPPYNTGNDFIFKDKFSVSERENSLAEGDIDEFGNRYIINTTQSGRYHANWLSMMYPRLRLAKNLLRDDGVIIVSIDDNEVHNLRHILNEIFGEESFVAMFPWRKRTAKSDVPFGISQDYEWLIAYAKSNTFIACIKGGTRRYYTTDDLPNRSWRVHDLTTQRDAGERPNSFFDMINPKNGKRYPANPNSVWRITKETFAKYYEENRIVFPGDYDFLNISKPVLRYFKEDDEQKAGELFGYVPVSTHLPENIGMTQNGTRDMRSLFDNRVFSFPKPVSIITFLIKITSAIYKDGIILDFFSGSATTAHAVMQLNAEDDGNRKFIMVQLPEVCPPDSEAARAGYKTISDIGKERIRRAGDKIVAESGKEIDIGFKVFKTADTNIRWIAQENGVQISQTHLDDTAKSVLDRRDFMPDATDIDVAYEILLRQWDIPLSATMETLIDIGQRTYCFADTVVVCLEEEVTREIVDKIASIEPMPHKVIFRDSAFGKNISLKLNTMERFDAMMKKHGEKTKQAYTVEFL